MHKYRDDRTSLEIDSCPECYGLWFDREELKLFFASPHLSKLVLEESAVGQLLPTGAPKVREDSERICPVCPDQCLFVSSLGKTEIDYCLNCHGIWLDQSELEQLVEAYRSGERGNLVLFNQLAEGLGTEANPNPNAEAFLETLQRYSRSI